MSKKISLIIAIVIALVGVLFVSIFGKLPDYLQPKILMEKIYFTDEKIEYNKSNEKIYFFDPKPDELSIDLYSMVQYRPYDTTNIDMKFTVTLKSGDGKPEDFIKITKTGFLTFKESAVQEFTDHILVVTVNSQDGSQLSDKIMIMRPSTDSGEDTFDDFIFWS